MNDMLKGFSRREMKDLSDAQRLLIKAKIYEVNGQKDKADQAFAQAFELLRRVFRHQPQAALNLLTQLQTSTVSMSPPLRRGVSPKHQNEDSAAHSLATRFTHKNPDVIPSQDLKDLTTPHTKGWFHFGSHHSGSSHSSHKPQTAEEAYEQENENYARAKEGFSVLQLGIKILSHIPVVKNFIPAGAGQVAHAAEQVGGQLAGPKEGFVIDKDGNLKVWNPDTHKFEDF
jgi:hypothetical protein